MREHRVARSIKCKEVFRIDWQNALKEAKSYAESIYNGKNNSFDDRVKAVGLQCEIQFMYSKDDIDGYLRFLDQNRTSLKHDTYSQSIGCVDIPMECEIMR